VEPNDAPQPVAGKKLVLRRETVHDFTDPILSTQGWSLWTCDDTGGVAGPDRPAVDRPG
jgi:hypothetical protein